MPGLDELKAALAERGARTPRLVLDALCPPALPVPPLTLRAWLVLERMGSPVVTGGDLSAGDALHAIAAAISPRQALAAWQDGALYTTAPSIIGNLDNTLAALHTRIREAFAPVPRDVPEEHDFRPPGCGWVLALIENLMATYAMSCDTALDTPISVAFCLRAAEAERSGSPLPGTSFIERDLLDAVAPPPPHNNHPPDNPGEDHQRPGK